MSDISAGERIYDAIQTAAADDPDLDGSVLVGYALVAEWASPAGGRWITSASSDASRTTKLTPWAELGLHRYQIVRLEAEISEQPDE